MVNPGGTLIGYHCTSMVHGAAGGRTGMARVTVVKVWRSSWNPHVEKWVYEVPSEKLEELKRSIKALEAQYEEETMIYKEDSDTIIELETCDTGLSCRNSIIMVDAVRETVEAFATKLVDYEVKEEV